MAEPLFLELDGLHRDIDSGIDRLEAPQMRLRGQCTNMLAIPAVLDLGERARVQARVYVTMSSGPPPAVTWARSSGPGPSKKLLIPRLPARPLDACVLLGLLAKWLPFGTVFASIRTIANAWPTSSLMARLDGTCRFCQQGLTAFCTALLPVLPS